MTKNKKMTHETFLSNNANRLPPGKLNKLQVELSKLDESALLQVQSLTLYNPTTFLLLYIFAPLFCCFDRFLTGNIGSGVVKIFTLGGFGIWLFVDIFNISSRVRRSNYDKIMKSIYPFL